MSVPSGIDVAYGASPDILNTPGLALDAAGSDDPTTFAPILTHAANLQSTAQAAADSNTQDDPSTHDGGGGGGFFNAIGHVFTSIPGFHGVAHALGTAVHALGAPLREVQRDYRFLHMIYAKQGFAEGFMSTLGVLGAFAGGTVAGGGVGGFAAAEAVLAAERGIAETGAAGNDLRKIADMSADPNIKISFGRDFANALGQVPGLSTLKNTDKGFGKIVSGGADATADWFGDPVVLGAKARTGLKLGEYGTATKALAQSRMTAGYAEGIHGAKTMTVVRSLFNGDLLRTMQADGAAKFFDKTAPGVAISASNPEALNHLYNSGVAGASYRRALDHIATLNTSDIVARYPDLQDLAPNVLKSSDGKILLPGLGAADTAEKAHQVFVNALENQHFADRLSSLSVVPTRTLTRVAPSKLADWAQHINGDVPVEDQSTLTGGLLKAGKQLATFNPGDAQQTIAGAIARKVRTFSGYMPFALDKNTLDLTAHTFTVDPVTQRVSPTAARGIMNTFRFSMGENRARYWTDQFLNAPDLAAQKATWAEANLELLKAAGLPDHNGLVQNIRSQIRELEAGPMGEPGGAGTYGVGAEFGSKVSHQPAGDSESPGALWSHQAVTQFSFPEFSVLKQQMRELQGSIKANYGRADDMVARKYVQTIFKPLALLNAGFGFRVAMAEAIPQAMRVGAMRTLLDTVNAKATRAQYKLVNGEDAHVLAAAAHALSDPEAYAEAGGKIYAAKDVQKAARRQLTNRPVAGMWTGINRLLNDPIARDRAYDLILRHDGHIAQGVGRTGESTGGWSVDQDPASRAQIGAYTAKSELKNDPQIKWAGSKDFDTFTPDADVYDGYWHGALSRISQEKPAQLIAADLLRADKQTAIENEALRIQRAVEGHADTLEAYAREAPQLRAYDNIKGQNWTAEDFATRRVDAVRGLTEGADGTVHVPVLNDIAAGRKPELDSLAAIEKPSRPAQVYGPVRVPYIGPNPMQRIISQGFTKVIDPIINGLSRDPMYFNAYSTELDHMQAAIKAGHIDEDTAARIAETRAVVGMLPKIHNTALRSQFAVLARNFMPFYFAQEQALKRAGKLIATHPEALRQYQLVEHGLSDPGFIHKDDQGNKFFVFPHLGWLGAGANGLMGMFGDSVQSGLPLSVQGSMSSLNTILPDFQQPGVSPLVSVPLNKLAGLFPELSPTVKELTGARGFGQSTFDALIPHPIAKAAWRVMNPDEKDSAFANALFTSMAASFYHGSAPDTNASASVKADWINRMKNNARSTFIVKGLLGLVSPLAPQVSNEDPGMRDEFYAEVKKLGYKDALAKFLKDHGTKSISYTVAHSSPTVPGAYMPYTNQALNWIQNNQGLLRSPSGEGAAFLVPQAQGKGDVQVVHAELIRSHLRQQDTPQQFLDAVDIALGNNAISTALEEHKANQAAAVGTAALQVENARWADYVRTQSLANPTWGDYWASPKRTQFAIRAWTQLKAIFESGSAPDTEQSKVILDLMDSYHQHALNMAQTATVAGRKVEKDNWDAYLQHQQDTNPLAYSAVNAIFKRLDGGLTPNGGGIVGQQ